MGEQHTELGSLDEALGNLDDMSPTEGCQYCDNKQYWSKETEYRPEKGVTEVRWRCDRCGDTVKLRKIPRGLD